MAITLVLNQVQSPSNVGVLVRSLLAFGGSRIVFLGHDLPWEIRKGSQAFSRKLERQLEVVHIADEFAIFDWMESENIVPVAVEISSQASGLGGYKFPENVALILGSEKTGLSSKFLERCSELVIVEQSGSVGSLNISAAGSIVLYMYNLQHNPTGIIGGAKYVGEAT